MRFISILRLLLGFSLLILISVSCGSQTSSSSLEMQDLAQITIATSEPTTEPPAESTSEPISESATELPSTAQLTQVPEHLDDDSPLTMEPVVGDRRSDEMSTYLANLTNEGSFVGTVLVAQNGDVLLNEGHGQANAAEIIPNEPETQFRIGSLTKQFTAAAILRLQEQGALSVQDPLAKFLPDYPRGSEISIHQLLIHSAGIPNYERRQDLQEVVQTPISLDDLIATFSTQPLEFPPGQRYQYSSSGYVLLTKIIEVASGQTYADYLENQILTPAEMTSTGYDFLSPDLPFPAVGYHLTPGGPRTAILTDSSWPTGAGALFSTVGDLYRWDRALYKDDLLNSSSLQSFFTPWIDTGQGVDYGYGWDIGTTSGRSSISHGGGIFGFASYMARFPEDDAVIIVLSNGIQMPPRVVAEGLAQILFADE